MREMAAFFVVNENFSRKHLRDGKMFVILQTEKRRSAFAWINCIFI